MEMCVCVCEMVLSLVIRNRELAQNISARAQNGN